MRGRYASLWCVFDYFNFTVIRKKTKPIKIADKSFTDMVVCMRMGMAAMEDRAFDAKGKDPTETF